MTVPFVIELETSAITFSGLLRVYPAGQLHGVWVQVSLDPDVKVTAYPSLQVAELALFDVQVTNSEFVTSEHWKQALPLGAA